MTEKEKAISELQGYLRNIGRYDRDIERIVPDGVFGKETENSVRSFERKYTDRQETGIVDHELWTRILEENEKAVFYFSNPKAISPVRGDDLPLKYGDRKNAVYHLKALLLNLSEMHSNFPSVTVNDYYDEETVEAVRQWQRAVRLEDNGITDKLTWNLLADHFS